MLLGEFNLLLASDPVTAVAYLVVTAVTLAASYFLSQQIGKQKKGNDLLPDFEPTNVATQGAAVPWLDGTRRVGCVIAWEGNRRPVQVPVGVQRTRRGKAAVTVGVGYAATGGLVFEHKRNVQYQTMNAASAWHLLCVGPGRRLQTVWENGKVIWSGDITPENTPSGTEVQTDTRGPFVISWGENDQPVVADIATATGIASAYPGVCSIFWKTYLTGQTTRWPQIEYELTAGIVGGSPCSNDTVEVSGTSGDETLTSLGYSFPETAGTHVYDSIAQESSANIEIVVPSGGRWHNVSDTEFGGPGLLRLEVSRYDVGEGITGEVDIRLTHDGVQPDIVLLEQSSFLIGTAPDECWEAEPGESGVYQATSSRGLARKFVFLQEGTWTFEATITVHQPLTTDIRTSFELSVQAVDIIDPVVTPIVSTVNFLYRLLFMPFPQGLNQSADDYDADSVNSVMEALADEGHVLSVYIKNNTEAAAVISSFLQDFGVLLSWNPTTGKYEFRLIRQETEALTFPEGVIESKLPEIEGYLGARRATSLSFSFPDDTRAYRDTVVTVDSDGRAKRLEVVQARKTSIENTVDFATAVLIAERRSQEELGNPAAFTIEALRGAKQARAGSLIRLPAAAGVTAPLRVLETTWKPDTNQTTLKAVIDNYSVIPSGATHGGSGGGQAVPSAEPYEDLAVGLWEVPEDIAPVQAVTVVVGRIRADANQILADIHTSFDDVNYVGREQSNFPQAGGDLIDGIAADGAWIIETGPTFNVLGPDIGQTEDLTADTLLWQRGRQCVMVDDELMFCRAVVAVSPGVYRLDGLIRARYGTARAAHAPGAVAYIFPLGNLTDMTDGLFVPGQAVYVKSQPWTSRPFPLADITAVSRTLEGKGLVPAKPPTFRVTAPTKGSASYRTGQDIALAWGYHSNTIANQGAGLVPVGSPYGTSPVKGTFKIELLDDMDVQVDEFDVATVTTYVLSNADIVAAFGLEPATFKIRLRNCNGTLRSPYSELTITKL